MPQPNKIPVAFADTGDKNSIPQSTVTPGLASWSIGFPPITSTPFANGGLAPKRADFNGIFNALSAAAVWYQQGGVFTYDNATDYEVGNVVEYSGDLYKCITANGPNSAVKAPTDATVWSKVMTSADVAAAYLPLAGGTMTGTITFTPANNTYLIRRADNNGQLVIVGGDSGAASSGAKLYLYGSGHGTYPGNFGLQAGASDGTYKALTGKSDGSLTWDGEDVERVRTSGTDYICYESGLQICWGYKSSITVNQENTINFGRAFADTNTVVLITRRSGASSTTVVDEAWIRGTPTTTSFGLYATTQTGYTWIAIGKGAA